MAGSASLHRYLGTSAQLPAHLPLSPLQSGGSLGGHQLAHVLQADPQFWTQAANLHEAPVGLDYFRLTFPILCGFCSGQDVQYVQLYWSSIYCWLLGNLRQDQTRHSCIQHPQLARELCPQPLHETAYQWICVWYASLAAFILIQCLHLRCQKWQILQCGQVAEIHDRICSKLPTRKWMECMGNKILHICIQMSQNL